MAARSASTCTPARRVRRANERERAALALTDSITLIAETHVPADVFEEAASHFDNEELASLIWQIAAINAWNRVAVATRTPIVDQPGKES